MCDADTSVWVRKRTMHGSVESKSPTTEARISPFKLPGSIANDSNHELTNFDACIVVRCCILIFRSVRWYVLCCRNVGT